MLRFGGFCCVQMVEAAILKAAAAMDKGNLNPAFLPTIRHHRHKEIKTVPKNQQPVVTKIEQASSTHQSVKAYPVLGKKPPGKEPAIPAIPATNPRRLEIKFKIKTKTKLLLQIPWSKFRASQQRETGRTGKQ